MWSVHFVPGQEEVDAIGSHLVCSQGLDGIDRGGSLRGDRSRRERGQQQRYRGESQRC